jgi:hypothetical protein
MPTLKLTLKSFFRSCHSNILKRNTKMRTSDIANHVIKSVDDFCDPIIKIARNILRVTDWYVVAIVTGHTALLALSLMAGEITTAVFVGSATVFAAQWAIPLITAHIIIETLRLTAEFASLGARRFCHPKNV